MCGTLRKRNKLNMIFYNVFEMFYMYLINETEEMVEGSSYQFLITLRGDLMDEVG